MAILANKKFSKNMDRKIFSRETTHCVIFLAQETELVQHIKVRHKKCFCVSGQWMRVTMIGLMRKDFHKQDGTLISGPLFCKPIRPTMTSRCARRF